MLTLLGFQVFGCHAVIVPGADRRGNDWCARLDR
jgi:hypothetical protein